MNRDREGTRRWCDGRTLASVLLASALAVGASACSRGHVRAEYVPSAPTLEYHTSIPWLPTSVRRFGGAIAHASARHGVDANLLAVVILVESGGDPYATSPRGASGLMQIMPATGREIAQQRGVVGHTDARLFDPAYNIDFGAYYLSRQLRRFHGANPLVTVERAAAAYNGGPGRMARHLRTGKPLPDETMRYKRWVAGMWLDRHQPSSPMYHEWWSRGGRRLVARTASAQRI